MAGHDSGTQHKFTGFQKYFNSYTITGRRNYVIATYASIAMIILYFKLRPKKQTPAVTEKYHRRWGWSYRCQLSNVAGMCVSVGPHIAMETGVDVLLCTIQ
ncbi:unnamed protein product [Eretmochelys imbricata]